MSECKEIQDECAVTPRAAQAWSVCLPWGGRIWSDGSGVHATPGSPPPDGTYGTITIAGGCIVGVGPVEEPLYTGNPCAPLPNPCGSRSAVAAQADTGVQGFAAGMDIMPLADEGETPSFLQGNLYTLDPVGRPLVRCYIEAGDDIQVTGDGSANNPFVITAARIKVEPVYLRSGNDAISITGTGDKADPFIATHKTGRQGLVNGMTFDAYGHLIDVSSGSANRGIQSILPGPGIEATPNQATGAVTVGLRAPATEVTGDYLFGGVKATVDESGRFKSLVQAVDLGGNQTIRAGIWDLALNAFGSIIGVTNALELGSAYYFSWLTGEPLLLESRFKMPIATGLCGILFGAPDSVAVGIDDMTCTVLYNAANICVFAGGGIFSADIHTLGISTGIAWPAANVCAILFAASPGAA